MRPVVDGSLSELTVLVVAPAQHAAILDQRTYGMGRDGDADGGM
jgi:hypothetical protein